MVKSNDSVEQINAIIEAKAKAKYKIRALVETYMNSIEEIVNIPQLLQSLQVVIKSRRIRSVIDEIVAQSRVEFNYPEDMTKVTADNLDEFD